MLVRPYGSWILFQQPHVGLLKKCRFAQLQLLTPSGFGFYKLDE